MNEIRLTAPAPQPTANVLTIDVEDWYYLSGRRLSGHAVLRPEILARQLDRVLGLLAHRRCRATFFCLAGSLAQAPQLVRRIADAGHEVGTHGWNHEPIFQIGLSALREDLKHSIDWLQDLLGREVKGYRAPAFSVPADQLEQFYDVCFELGLSYDSSVFPIRGPRYGIPDAPTVPHVVRQSGDRRLVELPLTTVRWRHRTWPVAGGGYWRLLPVRVILSLIRRVEREGRPMVTYLHPYEFDRQPLSALAAGGWSVRSLEHQLQQNFRRATMYSKLDRILAAHRFTSAEDYLAYLRGGLSP